MFRGICQTSTWVLLALLLAGLFVGSCDDSDDDDGEDQGIELETKGPDEDAPAIDIDLPQSKPTPPSNDAVIANDPSTATEDTDTGTEDPYACIYKCLTGTDFLVCANVGEVHEEMTCARSNFYCCDPDPIHNMDAGTEDGGPDSGA